MKSFIICRSIHQNIILDNGSSLTSYIGQVSKNAQPLHIRPEDGDINVCRNIALLLTFEAAQLHTLKLHTELQPRKAKDKKTKWTTFNWATQRRNPNQTSDLSHTLRGEAITVDWIGGS